MCQTMFDILMAKYEWLPIRGCRGRHTLASGITMLGIKELADTDLSVEEAAFDTARDLVCYCHFDGGGMISYKKPNGYLHTLCNEAGTVRKMAVLRGPDLR
jgi:hypothetical protein